MSENCYQFEVGPKEGGQTLLSFLKKHLAPPFSVKGIKRAIDAKQCLLNGNVEFFSTHQVRPKDRIEIQLKKKQPPQSAEILYGDEHVQVVNKPPNVTTESFEGFFLVHRLDKETSGALILAKTEEAFEAITQQFRQRKVEKLYLAICDKLVKEEAWMVDNYLGRKVRYQGGSLYGRVPKEKGKKATTAFRCLNRSENASLLEVRPITGRTHQIRVHLKEMGHPVLGDWQYGKSFSCPLRPPRQMLHAHIISFRHPQTGEGLAVKAPQFPDFLEVEKTLFDA